MLEPPPSFHKLLPAFTAVPPPPSTMLLSSTAATTAATATFLSSTIPFSLSLRISLTRLPSKPLSLCHAGRQQQRSAAPHSKKRPPRRRSSKNAEKPQVEVLPALKGGRSLDSLRLPKPPAGFVLDDSGKVLLASNRRIITIVDPSNNRPLECVIRRVFKNSSEEECMVLCPADMPVQILKSRNFEGWSAIDDEETESVVAAAAYALAKIHLHLVVSGFCLTARGGFCYLEEDILVFHTDSGEDGEDLPSEGVEIISFNQDTEHYMIYTPIDPQMFVAVKNQDGILQIAEYDQLEDPAVIAAIDEETEFNALVEEEEALLASATGERP